MSAGKPSVDGTDALPNQISRKKQMNRFEGVTKPLRWFMAILLAAFLAGCGDDETIVIPPDTGPAGASPVLGTASTYGLFASSAAVNLAADSSVTGDVGLNPAGACNNCVVGVTVINGVIHNGDAAAIQAKPTSRPRMTMLRPVPSTPARLPGTCLLHRRRALVIPPAPPARSMDRGSIAPPRR